MREYLVDDDLEEDRRDKREYLHEERGEQHMRERLAVAPDRGQKPAEAERLGVVAFATETAGDQHDDRVYLFEQFIGGKLAEELRDRIDDAAFACRTAGDQDRERTV